MNNIFSHHLQLTKEVIATGILAMNPAEVETVVNLIREHDRVILCSMGKPAFAVGKVVYTAHSFGLEWRELDATHAMHGDVGIVRENDLVLIVSKSGETSETNEVANYLYHTDNVTVAVTSDRDSQLASLCDHQLIIPVMEEGSPFGYAPMASTTLYMMVLHGLLCEAIEAQGCTPEQYAANHSAGAIGAALSKEVSKGVPILQ